MYALIIRWRVKASKTISSACDPSSLVNMPNLPTRSDLHLKRKVFHAAFGCLFAYASRHHQPAFIP